MVFVFTKIKSKSHGFLCMWVLCTSIIFIHLNRNKLALMFIVLCPKFHAYPKFRFLGHYQHFWPFSCVLEHEFPGFIKIPSILTAYAMFYLFMVNKLEQNIFYTNYPFSPPNFVFLGHFPHFWHCHLTMQSQKYAMWLPLLPPIFPDESSLCSWIFISTLTPA